MGNAPEVDRPLRSLPAVAGTMLNLLGFADIDSIEQGTARSTREARVASIKKDTVA
jgi:hypothetical protein